MFGQDTLARWQHHYANFALTGGNLFILLLGFQIGSVGGWKLAFGLVALTSAWAWYANLRRYRTVADTPTSRIVSAPQGYIEIAGRGKHPPGERLVSPHNGLPCLWYRYRLERKRGDNWVLVESGASHDTFGIDDGSGQMLVDPDGAEIVTSHRQIHQQGNYRTIEWTLIENETLYVIGEHVTLGGPNAMLDKHADISQLLAEWKRDKQALLARFDVDRNGELSLEEWERARKDASDAVDRAHLDIRLKDGVHLMRKPSHRRPFLIANREVDALTRRYRFWSWGHLAAIAGSLVALALI